LARKYILDYRIHSLIEIIIIGPVNGAQLMFSRRCRARCYIRITCFYKQVPRRCIAFWIAIDRINGENGGLQVVPGSHKYNLVCPEAEMVDVETSVNCVGLRLPRDMVPVQTVMEPGDARFFHGSMVHGLQPNRTVDRWRRSLIFHFVPKESVEIAGFFLPAVGMDGREVVVKEAEGRGVCGEGWPVKGPH
jgi:ectoine hydroxylase-related dioxygenase (phytanoyl-CoA dioxygenase family)